MIPEEILKGDIKEYCIACLTKSPVMYNLNEQVDKRSMFTTVFSIELDNNGALPQYLCYICDIMLNTTHNFQEAVRKCLAVLQEYNEKLMQANLIEKVKEEIDEEYNELKIEINKSGSEEVAVQLKEEVHQRVSGIKIGSPEGVNRVVEEFKNQRCKFKTCVLCGFIAANRKVISSHMVIFHKDRKNSTCIECKDIFENHDELKQTHSSKYSCPFCDKDFNTSRCVEQLQNHSGTFSCTVCNKAFKSVLMFKKHKCIHANDKPFSCPNCSKCFIQLSSLRYHVVTHGNFPCESCEKRYKSTEELKGHECVAMEKLPSVNEVWINADDGIESQGEEIDEAVVIKGNEPLGSDVDYKEHSPSQDPIATDEHSPSEKPGVSGITKKTRKRIIHSGQRQMAFNFYTSYKNQGLSKSKSVALTASSTGISERTVWKIVQDMETFGVITSPFTKRKRADMFNKLDEEQLKTLRGIIHSFLLRNEAPTLHKLKKAVDDEETLPSMKRTTLWQTLRKMGIAWERRGGTRVLLESASEVVS